MTFQRLIILENWFGFCLIKKANGDERIRRRILHRQRNDEKRKHLPNLWQTYNHPSSRRLLLEKDFKTDRAAVILSLNRIWTRNVVKLTANRRDDEHNSSVRRPTIVGVRVSVESGSLLSVLCRPEQLGLM